MQTYLVVQQADPSSVFLKTVWTNVKAQLDDIIKRFDVDADAVIRGPQQNTYDTAMYGANTFIGSYYVTALRAGAAMATCLGDSAYAAALTQRAALAATSYDRICWNEAFGYFTADVTLDNCKYSYGPGCFVDQLCGTGLALAVGFGYLFTPDGKHEASARRAVVHSNTVTKPPWNDLQGHLFDGDSGVTVCTYPNGRLGDGMMYDTLISTGFTSPVIAGLVYDRNEADALLALGHIRQRQDGRHRSPWNEPECDVLYSRAMAHWNIFDQSCGFEYNSQTAAIAFDPRFYTVGQQFECFVVLGSGWGQFTQVGDAALEHATAVLRCMDGSMTIGSLSLKTSATTVVAEVNGKRVSGSLSGGRITFAPTVQLAAADSLTLTFGTAERVGAEAEPKPKSSVEVFDVPTRTWKTLHRESL